MLDALKSLLGFNLQGGGPWRKVAKNTGWLAAERLVKMGLSLLISIMLARHLGTTRFGFFSYSLSLMSLLTNLLYLGLGGLVIRDLVTYPNEKYSILGTTFFLKIVGASIAFCIICLFSRFGGMDQDENLVMLLVGSVLLFRPFEVIEYWFHSQTQAKWNACARMSALALVTCLNVALVRCGAGIVSFSVVVAAEAAVASCLLTGFYCAKGELPSKWSVSAVRMRSLFSECWILMLSGLCATANLRIDQLMLRWLAGSSEVGIYSIAANLSEAWYFVPAVISLSLYPSLIEVRRVDAKAYLRTVQRTLDSLALLALSMAVFVVFLMPRLIVLLYGVAYEESGSILSILIWAGIFVFMRTFFSRLILIEPNMLPFSLLTHAAGAAVNVVLNLFLIPRYGAHGAAWATLVSYATSSYVALYFAPRTRPFAHMMTKSLFFPVRWVFG